jgi:hypothetical protein
LSEKLLHGDSAIWWRDDRRLQVQGARRGEEHNRNGRSDLHLSTFTRKPLNDDIAAAL